MYKINDYVVYRHDVCIIKNIKETNEKKSYVMVPIDDESLIIETPVDNKMGCIRDLISLSQTKQLIDSIPSIDLIDNYTEKNLESIYKDMLSKGSHKELIQIIKTSYIRNNERIKNKKKISDKDDKYFKLAEKYLYTEFSIVLNMTFEETKDYITQRVTKLSK